MNGFRLVLAEGRGGAARYTQRLNNKAMVIYKYLKCHCVLLAKLPILTLLGTIYTSLGIMGSNQMVVCSLNLEEG